MPRGKNTQEYQTVKKNFPNLSGAIAGVLNWVCERLLAEGLITGGQKAEASNGMIPANKRASDVTALLLNKVEQDAQNFQTLIGVLQQDMDTFGTVLKHMGVTDASGSTNGATVNSTSGGDTHYPCTLVNLETELKELTNPYLFGVHLGVASNDLEQIERDHRNDVARQRSEVIKYWCRNYECTWEKVADAVKKLGGHGILEKRLRQLHTKGPQIPTMASSSAHPNSKDDKVQETAKQPAMKFSDNLSPNDLVAWLSQELTAKGLTLSEEMKDKLIEEEINGAAFKRLSNEDLTEMGFKRGPRMNIMDIIKDLKQTDAEV